MVVALVALVFSTTGLADAARHAVVSAIAGHPVSSKPRADGILALGKQQKFPAVGDPHGRQCQGDRRQDGGRKLEAPARPNDRRRRHLVPGINRLSADQRRRRQEQLHLGQQEVRGSRRLAALRLAS